MSDLAEVYKVRPAVKKGASGGLDKYDQSMYPGTTRFLFPTKDRNTGKYITGLDPDASEIWMMDEKERDKKRADIIKMKTELEQFYGKPGLLDATNDDFWANFGIHVECDTKLKTRITIGRDTVAVEEITPASNPVHRLGILVLRANGFLPMTQEEASHPDFYKEPVKLVTGTAVEAESQENNRNQKLYFKYINELFPEDGNAAQHERAWNISYLMNNRGASLSKNINASVLEDEFHQVTKDPRTMQLFLAKNKLSNQELAVEVIVKKALQLDMIKYDTTGGVYRWGGQNYESTIEKTMEFLKLESNASRLAQLKEAVDKVFSKKK